MSQPLVNWAGNVAFSAVRLAQPSSEEELCSVVAASGHVRALGTGHSFSTVADCSGTLVRLSHLPRVLDIDTSASTVTVSAGLRYTDIGEALHARGYALANLASLPHITVAGSVATGTHGSGDSLQNLAAAVVGLTLVSPSGDLVTLDRDDPSFAGAVVSLGALGIVTSLALRIEPTFEVSQTVRLGVPLAALESSWDEVFGAAYSVSAFTTYVDGLANVFLKQRPSFPGTGWLGGSAASRPVHPIPTVDPGPCTPQLGVPGPWHERLPHFRPDHTPSVGDELQSEFFVARSAAPSALSALRGLASRLAPVLHVSELRTIAADDLWLSPAYGRDSVGFHFTWIRDLAAVLPVVSLVESVLLPLGARPHWGKVTTVDVPALLANYPRAADFASLRERLDPNGKFSNDYTSALVD